jgi:hypothetical protein
MAAAVAEEARSGPGAEGTAVLGLGRPGPIEGSAQLEVMGAADPTKVKEVDDDVGSDQLVALEAAEAASEVIETNVMSDVTNNELMEEGTAEVKMQNDAEASGEGSGHTEDAALLPVHEKSVKTSGESTTTVVVPLLATALACLRFY